MQLADQLVESRLAALVAFQLDPSEHFDRQQRRLAGQDFGNDRPKRFRLRRTANPADLVLAAAVDMRDRRFTVDALNGAPRDAGERCHFDLAVPGASQNLNLVPFEHVDHPFPRCLVQRVCDPKGPAQYGQNFRRSGRQNFRKGGRQNFRNPQKLPHFDSDLLRAAIEALFQKTLAVAVPRIKRDVALDYRPLAAGYGGHLFNQIARDIIGADIAVFETSDLNPNVMIEMGVALTWGTRVHPIRHHAAPKPPSDISGQTWAAYDANGLTWLDADHDLRLAKMVEIACKRKPRRG